MTKSAMRHCLCLVSMLVLCIGKVFSQSVVNFGSDLNSTKYYESMNAATPPAGEWYAVDFDDSNWSSYTNPLDYPEHDTFWVRRSFVVADNPANHSFQLKIAHDCSGQIYINGYSVHSDWGCGRYNYVNIPNEYLVKGLNVLAAYSYDEDGGSQYIECYVVTVDGSDIIMDLPKQPLLVISSSELCLYKVDGYSGSALNSQMVTSNGLVDAQISWISSNPEVATVLNGQISAVSAGKATITASAVYNSVTYTKECKVEVREVDPESKVVIVNTPGTLGTLLTDDEKENITNLTLFGKLDGRDVQVLRYMAGRNEKGNRTPGALADLDMYNVEFVDGGNNSFKVNNNNTSYVYAGRMPNYMFYDCVVLNSVVLPESVSRIGHEAFYNCTNLEKVLIPNSITSIEGYAFNNCGNLKSFELPASITEMGDDVFANCKRLESFSFAEGTSIESIPGRTFCNSNLKSIVIPVSVTTIGSSAFANNYNLANVVFEDGSKLLEIGNTAFHECNSLQRIDIPEGCLEIGNNCFNDCDNLLSVTIPVSLVSIGDEAFRYCRSLTELNIPENSKLSSIGANGLVQTNLSTFYIPKGLISITDVFSDSYLPQSMTAHPENKYYESVGGILYSKRDKTPVLIPKSIDGFISFPDYVTSIPENMLKDCSRLKGVILHSGITKLGNSVLSGCSALQTLMTLSSVPATISAESFSGINKSTVTLVVPQGSIDAYSAADGWKEFENIQEAGDQPIILLSANNVIVYDVSDLSARTSAITATVITKDGISALPVTWSTSDAEIAKVVNGVIEYAGEGTATITASVTEGEYTATTSCTVTSVGMSSGKMVFVSQAGTLSTLLTDQEKAELTHLIVMGNLNSDDIRVLRYMAGRDEFSNLTVGSLETLDMGKARIVYGGEGYMKESTWWRTVSENKFGDYIFRECNSLKKVVLPSSLKTLGSYAFNKCSNLEEVVIPDGLTNIEYDAFAECRKLSKVNIPSSVTSMSSEIFRGCSNLKSIDLSNMTGVNTIPESMFLESGLTSICIPANISNINNCAFSNTPLKTLEFERGSKLATIGGSSFQSTQLQSVTIPASVTTIGNYAFNNCQKLTEIKHENNNKLTSLGCNVFDGCPITSFIVPKSLIYMESQNFSETLTQVVVEDGNKYFESIDGVLYSKSENSLVYVPKEQTSVYMPDYVTTIKNGALNNHYNLTTVVLAASVSDLGESPFCNDYNLKEIYCMTSEPPKVRYLTNGWRGKIYIPTGSIEEYEAENWDVDLLVERSYSNSISISASDLTLYNITGGNSADLVCKVFSGNGPVQSPTVTWASSDANVAAVNSSGKVDYVGPGTAKIIASTILEGTTYSAECNVKTVAISDTEHAYYLTGQGNLRTLIGNDNKYDIEKLILAGKMSDDDRNFIREMSCERWDGSQYLTGLLKYLDMSELVDTIIGTNAFNGCVSLETVLLPKNTQILNEQAFAYCHGLKTITIPGSVLELKQFALRDCRNLSSVQFLGTKAPKISNYTFEEIGSGFCIIVPAGSEGYTTDNYWKDMTNIYQSDILPMLIISNKDVELYNITDEGANTQQLDAYVISTGGIVTTGISWTSSDTEVATVSATGLVTAGSKEGNAIITASYTEGGKTATVNCPVSLLDVADYKFVYVETAGTLASLLTEDEILDIKKLIVSGNLNNDDICVLRKMAGRDENGNLTAGSLEVLNMKKAKIVSGGQGYYYRDNWWRTVSSDYFGSDVFRECNSLKEVVLPSSLKTLGSNAFYKCSNLEEVVIPDGLTNIEYEAFAECRKLSKVNIPSSVTSMSSEIFRGCSNLKSIDLSTMTGMNNIPSHMFYQSGLTNVLIPASVTSINNNAFCNTPLKSVVFENGSRLASINDGAFQSTQLQSITIPGSVLELKQFALRDCRNLSSVQFLGMKAPKISNYTFEEIGSGFCIIVPAGSEGYTTDNYWKDMTNICQSDILPMLIISNKDVELYNITDEGANTQQLDAYVISTGGIVTTGINWTSSDTEVATVSATGLVTAGSKEGNAIITASYTEGGKTATVNCPVSLLDVADYKFVYVETAGTLASLLTEDEILDIKKLIVSGNLNNDDICVLRKMAGRDENGNLTAGSLEVLNMKKAKIVSGGQGYYYRDGWWRSVSNDYFNSDIFRECNSLKKVVLPTSLKTLGSNAFYKCSSLEEVVIPDGLTNIEYDAFAECRKLSKVNIPSSVTNMSSSIFYGCTGLKTIDLSNMTGVNTIPESMFRESGLTSICIPANISNINSCAFSNTPLKTLEFERGSKLATINDGAFQSTQLQSITIPASVTSIGNYAFNDCQKLTKIGYEDNNKLNTIGDDAFNGCPIDTFFIPKRVVSMGRQNFSEYLTEIVIEDGNKYFENFDGALCSKAEGSLIFVSKRKKSLYLPDYVTTLQNGVLQSHYELQLVVLSANMENLGDYPFSGDYNLQEVYCLNPEPPTSRYLSSGISNMSVYIAEGSLDAYKDAGWNDSRITLIEHTFSNSLSLTTSEQIIYNVEGGNKVRLEAKVFSTAGPLPNAAIDWVSSNPSVVSVGSDGMLTYAGQGSATVTASIKLDGNVYSDSCVVNTKTIDNVENTTFVFVESAGNLNNQIPAEDKKIITNLVVFGNINGTDVSFIREMAGIPYSSWSSDKPEGALEYLDLSNATIVEGGNNYGYVEWNNGSYWLSTSGRTEPNVIGTGMFMGSPTLKTIILPNNIIYIDQKAFSDCINLESVVLPKSLSFIDYEAFNNCPLLSTFVIPESIDSLGTNALRGFDEIYANSLTPIKILGSSLISEDGLVIVPAEALQTYRSAENWKQFAGQIMPDNLNIQSVVTLNVTAEEDGSGLLTAAGGDDALAFIKDLTLKGTINSYDILMIRNRMPRLHYLDLTDVDIIANPYEYYTDSHTEKNRLGRNAFRELNKLRRVVLPKSIDYVGDNAFYHCENLTSVKMYKGVNTIDNNVFAECYNLVDVELAEGLLSIGSRAFYRCDNLEGITLPSTVLSIGSNVFENCYSLKSIVLPNNITRIEWDSFWYCSNLESVTLPSKVNRIESNAFYGCSKLKELRLPPMIESIGDKAFYDCGNIKDVYVYIANSKDIRIDQNTFSCWTSATLHIPSFSYSSYYWDTQWGQFYSKVEFSETYDEFYTKNTLALNDETGVIEGDPNAVLYEQGGLVVEDVEQVLDEVELKSDGTDGASLIATETGSIKAAKLTININVNAYKWHFFSFPFDIPLDSIHYDGEYVWRQYDGLARSRRQGGWQNLAAGTKVLSKGRGYIFQGTKEGSLSFTIENPDLSAKNESTSLFTHESQDAQDANWNFVGNPYTAYYNIDESTYSAPITVWTGYGYEAYRPGDDDYQFAPYQAFFVQTPDSTDAINFSAEGRESYEEVVENRAARRVAKRTQTTNPSRLFVNLEISRENEDSYIDKTRIVFNNSKSLEYEPDCDAAKFFSDERAIELYSLDSNGATYSINERPVDDGNVKLGIYVNSAGTYIINAVRMDNNVLLIDKERRVTHDLSIGGYSFMANSSTEDRFVLKFGNTTKVLETKSDETNDEIYDLQGRKLNGTEADGVIIRNGKKMLGK